MVLSLNFVSPIDILNRHHGIDMGEDTIVSYFFSGKAAWKAATKILAAGWLQSSSMALSPPARRALSDGFYDYLLF
ncbi:MAG: hypothetical protein HC916_15475 [Coleofasciculaceae cyanobacterium SM2_1_6]|nr:hypothetical protein [Coleofasciculaceae cyanobacterium SM2_1_6]